MNLANARLFLAVPFIAALAACGGESADTATDVAASGDEPAELEMRHENFESIGDNFKLIRANFEEGVTPDLDAVEAAASDINARAKEIEKHFPEGSGRDSGWDTEALATIWEQPEKFAEAQDRLIEESATMVQLAASGDAAATGAHIRELGGTCKNCHDTFRLDDD